MPGPMPARPACPNRDARPGHQRRSARAGNREAVLPPTVGLGHPNCLVTPGSSPVAGKAQTGPDRLARRAGDSGRRGQVPFGLETLGDLHRHVAPVEARGALVVEAAEVDGASDGGHHQQGDDAGDEVPTAAVPVAAVSVAAGLGGRRGRDGLGGRGAWAGGRHPVWRTARGLLPLTAAAAAPGRSLLTGRHPTRRCSRSRAGDGTRRVDGRLWQWTTCS
jgi:hypothetical protein